MPAIEMDKQISKTFDHNQKTDISDSISETEQKIQNDDSDCDKLDDDDCGSDVFEIEESEAPLIPVYKLKDEGPIKWVLLSDLCNVLKVKSKDTLLKQVRIFQ